MSRRKSEQLEFDFGDDYFPKKPTWHNLTLELFDNISKTYFLLNDLHGELAERQCAEIRASTKWFATEGIGSKKEWKRTWEIIERLRRLNSKATKIQKLLSDHGFNTVEEFITSHYISNDK